MKSIFNIMIATMFVLTASLPFMSLGLDPMASIVAGAVSCVALEYVSRTLPQGSLMVTCGNLSANISKSCTNPVQAGTKDRGIILNFDDVIGITYDTDGETVKDLILSSGAVGYVIDGQNNSIEPLCTMVQQGFLNMFDHTVTMKGFDISPATKNEVNSMKDGRFIIVTENFFKGTDGNSAFEVYGLTAGLEMSEIERNPNSEETQGAFHFVFTTIKNKEPKIAATFYDTDYTTTKAIVDALLV